jgi:FAD binding domain
MEGKSALRHTKGYRASTNLATSEAPLRTDMTWLGAGCSFQSHPIQRCVEEGFVSRSTNAVPCALRQVVLGELVGYNAAVGQGSDPFGKTVFPAVIEPEGPLHVAQIAPVVHYCMGGVRIDSEARVVDTSGRPIPGLYAAGEATGEEDAHALSSLKCIGYAWSYWTWDIWSLFGSRR